MAGIVDAPRGFQPIKSFGGEVGRVNGYKLATANTALGKWDLLNMTSAGHVNRAAASDLYIVGAAATHAAASAGTEFFPVYDDPYSIFLCQSDDSTIAADTDFNLNYNIVVANASNNVSQMEADGNTGDTTNTLPLKALRYHRQSGNTVGANVALEVIINNHVLSGNLAGI